MGAMEFRFVEVAGPQLDELETALQQAAGIEAAEGEDKQKVARWKYACGRNRQKVIREQQRRQAAAERLRPEPGRFEEYRSKVDAAMVEAARGKDGAVTMRRDGQGHEEPMIPIERRAALRRTVKALNREYAEAIAEREKLAAEVETIMAAPAVVAFFRCDWADVPERIQGAYPAYLAEFMIDNVPADLRERAALEARKKNTRRTFFSLFRRAKCLQSEAV